VLAVTAFSNRFNYRDTIDKKPSHIGTASGVHGSLKTE
jgi:hypothetical protein